MQTSLSATNRPPSIGCALSSEELEPQKQQHLFVVGFFRSGTSLLYSFLNLHPRIKLVFEADVIGNPLLSSSALLRNQWWDRLDFYNSSLSRHGLSPLPEWQKATCPRQQADALYHQYGSPQMSYIGEKSPSYYNRLPVLARTFPKARFLIIWRHPQDVISSIRKAGREHHFFRSRSLPLCSLLGLEQMQNDVLALRQRGSSVFDFCYEDLIQDPEKALRSICEFLGLPFDPCMLELQNADCSMFPPGEHHSKAKSGQIHVTRHESISVAQQMAPKVSRYLSRWRGLYNSKLATSQYWKGPDQPSPSWMEVLSDRFHYVFKRFWREQFVPFVYGFVPYHWLRTYRRIRGSEVEIKKNSRPRTQLKFSVVTPSRHQLRWLKLCAASIADQQGVEVEHIIQDSQSGPELATWISENTRARFYVESDTGMYDAINRGFARATGDIVSWLNCDEQYTEGALARVADYFDKHPEIDVLFGDALLVGKTGKLLSYRRTVFPSSHHIRLAHLNVLSCATFVRRSVLERGHHLEERWKAIADAVWIVGLLEAGIPMAVLNEPLAIFTITDQNLGQTDLAFAETLAWQQETSANRSHIRPWIVLWHRLQKLINGAYVPRSVISRFFTLASSNRRVTRSARSLGFHWPQQSRS